ncbi:hypothetical protein FO519_009853 [Halicephalobus sp. NKZ332]|nr:hypothetical protein FO519_009853 [Halicephalobus sp. NKZ332]
MPKFISLLLLGALILLSDSVIIKSFHLNNFGKWHDMDHCPPNMYAVGKQLKIEEDQGYGDDTGLNAVGLYCEPLNSTFHTNNHRITSGVGPFGEWGNISYCPEGQVIVGFYMHAHVIPFGDDIAATDFFMLCEDPFGSRDPSHLFKNFTPDQQEKFRDHICPKGFAVYGIQTQVEEEQGNGDDTALNNVNLDCREITSCTHVFVTLFDYFNSGPTPVSRSYTERITYTRKSGRTEEKESSERTKWHAKASSSIKSEIGVISHSINVEIGGEFGWESEKMTSEKLISMVEHIFHHEKEVGFALGKANA